uniref:Uncharacterized protein n=1 Tax=Arundo donax TaxID=35708 RepID=A0A0A8ZKH8_ARUDO
MVRLASNDQLSLCDRYHTLPHTEQFHASSLRS